MAAYSDVGALCSQCGQQDFLPFRCDGCQLTYCEGCRGSLAEHRVGCPSSSAYRAGGATPASTPKVACASLRCVVAGCKEQHASAMIQCASCGQRVCLSHRFEDKHPCVDTAKLVSDIRRGVPEADRRPACEAMAKLLGNVVASPQEDRFRRLKKANAALQAKVFRFPACLALLRICGFEDEGQELVCHRGAEKVAIMKLCLPALQAAIRDSRPAGQQKPATIVDGVLKPSAGPTTQPSQQGACAGASGPAAANRASAFSGAPAVGAQAAPLAAGHRVLQGGVIVERPAAPPPADVPTPTPEAGVTAASSAVQKPGAFDFKRRGDAEAALQAQQEQLAEARRARKEQFKQGGGPGAAASGSRSSQAGSQEQAGGDGCVAQ